MSESMLLRGASARAATPYRQAAGVLLAPPVGVRPVPPPAEAPPAESATPATSAMTEAPTEVAPSDGTDDDSWAGTPNPVLRAADVSTDPAVLERRRADRRGGDSAVPNGALDRRGGTRRAADIPVPNGRGVLRLGDVYAEELARLREYARREGYAAGRAEGLAASADAVAEAEQNAARKLAETQARWERRMVSGAAALATAAGQLEASLAPTTDDLRETVLTAVLELVEELLGRELRSLDGAASAGVDALRRALTLLPTDAPCVVRLHPDDLAELPPDAHAALPATVTLVGDLSVERAGAIAESGVQRVDAQLGLALARVRAVLSA